MAQQGQGEEGRHELRLHHPPPRQHPAVDQHLETLLRGSLFIVKYNIDEWALCDWLSFVFVWRCRHVLVVVLDVLGGGGIYTGR